MKEQLQRADEQVSLLSKDARDAQFNADSLALARDLAQIGAIFKEVTRTEEAKRVEKVLHARSQHVIGQSIIAEFMGANMAVVSGVVRDQLAAIDRVGN